MAEPKRQNLKVVDDGKMSREPDLSASDPSGVAAVLRAARLRAGVDLRDVAEALRIRYPYLQAIEDGRFADLPGPTYALGFVRAYADFLELDGKEIVRQFKDEGQGLSRRQTLVFPEPLQEGRFPGATVLLFAVVVAAAVYGGWYYWQHRQTNRPEAVSPVPSNLATLTQPKTAPAPAASTPAPAQTTTPTEAQAGSTPSTPAAGEAATSGSPPPASTETGAAPAATVAAPTVPASPPPDGAPSTSASSAESAASPQAAARLPAEAPSSASAGASPPTPAIPPVPPAPPAKPAAATAAATPASPSPSGGTAGSGDTASSAIPSAPDQVASLKPNEPRVYGEGNADSRITLTAKQDSWVQIRDKDSNVIWTRILRPGDSYKVPNQQGLTLLTGNAGALDVTVDGKAAPPLGALGAVRRNIPLDPAKIASGSAGGQ
jgi:cytoskeleton protein RodZ